jgi:hypothetical protein
MMAADRTIRWSTAGAVVGVAAVAAVASYEHAYDLVRAHGEVGWTARPVLLQILHRDAATSEGALPDDILDAHSAYST